MRAAVLVLAVLAASCGPSTDTGPNLTDRTLLEPAANWPTYGIGRKRLVSDLATDGLLAATSGAVTGEERRAIETEIRQCMDEVWQSQGAGTVRDLANTCAAGYRLSRLR